MRLRDYLKELEQLDEVAFIKFSSPKPIERFIAKAILIADGLGVMLINVKKNFSIKIPSSDDWKKFFQNRLISNHFVLVTVREWNGVKHIDSNTKYEIHPDDVPDSVS